jgi:hypothetical protein
MTKSITLAAFLALVQGTAFAQTPPPTVERPLSTHKGHALNLSVQHYDYTEPPPVDISIHGPKFGGEYTGTFSLSDRRRLFAQLNVRGTGATADYDGNCRPWQIAPSDSSPNGYRLTLGTKFPCSEDNDVDWYVDGRALIGRDFIGNAWAIAPFIGVGGRHLSNGVTGNANYRTQEYLYLPVGATVRTSQIADRTIALTLEYDHLLRGWNTTRNSFLGGGTVPATTTTPQFTIGDFEDLSFDQTGGWALRASASVQLGRRWTIEPYYVRWSVDDSTTDTGSAAYTVNGITARQALSYYEPVNRTNEFGVKFGFSFSRD